jgi:membrane protease YdiL (CAAX protease family)
VTIERPPEAGPKAARGSPAREAIALWAICFALIITASLLVPSYAKLVATVSFLYLPLLFARRQELPEKSPTLLSRFRTFDYREFGVSTRNWRRDVKLALGVFAVIAPVYFVAYLFYPEILKHLPRALAVHLSPHLGIGTFHLQLPARFGEWAIDQTLVVALPEEFFYRGYLQTRLRESYPGGKKFLGARLGPAFFLTASLFAVGHLAIFEVWRLGVFFPALLFGWLREKTGTVLGATLLHAAFNLYEMVLQASFFGPR